MCVPDAPAVPILAGSLAPVGAQRLVSSELGTCRFLPIPITMQAAIASRSFPET